MAKPKYSTDKKVKFYEKSHKYKLGKRELTSVTTFLKKYFSPFDADKIAKFKAMLSRKQGRPEETATWWKRQWTMASEHGTRVHALLEDFLLEVESVDFNSLEDRDLKKYHYASKWLSHYLKCVDSPNVITEMLIYNEFWGLAGQVDVVVERKNKDGKVVLDILDFKTNKAITKVGYRGAMATDPIADMPDCSFTKYTLQMSLYAYMLEQLGFEIGELTLLHLSEDKCTPMRVEYRKDLVLKLLENGESY